GQGPAAQTGRGGAGPPRGCSASRSAGPSARGCWGQATVASGAAHQGIQPPLAEPGAEDHLPRWREGDPHVLIPVRSVGGKGEVVKECERLPEEGREIRRAQPG